MQKKGGGVEGGGRRVAMIRVKSGGIKGFILGLEFSMMNDKNMSFISYFFSLALSLSLGLSISLYYLS